MKKRTIFGLFLLMFAIIPAMAQQETDTVFRFENQVEDIDFKSIDRTLIPANYFGEDIALKYFVMHQRYTFVVKGTPSSPGDKTQIEKPVIYNNVKKMNRYYKKMVKKGLISKEDAKKRLHHVLNVGLSVKNNDTSAFEDSLRKLKAAEDVASFFEAVILE